MPAEEEAIRGNTRLLPRTPFGFRWLSAEGDHELSRRLDLVLLVLVALAAAIPRLLLQFQAPVFIWGDSRTYVEPAQELLSGIGFNTAFQRTAGYPLFVVGVFSLFGPNLSALTAVQHGLGVLTVVFTYLLGRSCFNRWVGLSAALLVAISGPQLGYEHSVMTESLFTVLLVALALTLVRARSASSYAPALLAGCLLGLAAVVRPVGQGLLPLALIFAALRPGTRWQRSVSAVLLALVFLLVVTPWMLRNLAVHGRFSLGGTLGTSLMASTLKYSRGKFVFDSPSLPPEPDPARLTARRIIQAGVEKGSLPTDVNREIRGRLRLTQAATDQLVQRVVLDTVRRQPLDFIARMPAFFHTLYSRPERSFRDLWESSEHLEEDELSLRHLAHPPTPQQEALKAQTEALLNLYQPSRYGLVLPIIAFIGLVAAWAAGGFRVSGPALVPGGIALFLVLAHVALNGPAVRYRYPVEPFLNVLMLGGFSVLLCVALRLLTKQRQHSQRAEAIPAQA